jgi:HK97 family phage prohead protease
VNHNTHELPVAYPTAAKQDDTGLLIAGKFHNTPAGQECRTVIKERMAAGLKVKGSIGYRTIDSAEEKIRGKYVRRLKSIDVWECSFVNLPANVNAEVVSAKSLDQSDSKLIAINQLKEWLDELYKSGRVLSSASHKKISGHLDVSIQELTDAKAYLDAHDPSGSDPEPPNDLQDGPLVGGGGRVVGKAAQLKQLRLRVLRSRVETVSPHQGVKP